MSKIVDVAAAVFLREGTDGTEYLLAQRPPDKVYAGYWEFPGGKVEPGETLHEALIREIEEEMGATIERAWPWLSRQFTYPHATVRLKFFQVESWRGELCPLEHSGIVWIRLGDTPPVDPVLPANGPILRALALPQRCCVLDATSLLADQLSRAVAKPTAERQLLRVSHVTDLAAPQTGHVDALRNFIAENPATDVFIDDDQALARTVGAQGIHLTEATLRQTHARPAFDWVSASCRNESDFAHAIALGVDFVAFPVPNQVASSDSGNSTEWTNFATWIERSPIPVFIDDATGTLSLNDVHPHGVHGLMTGLD